MAKAKGKKPGGKGVESTEHKTRPVRLDLAADIHHMLRQLAAKRDVSMAAFARDALSKLVVEECRKEGIKP